ncbi:MAG: hypothetical protein ACMXYL_04590 [Candidatus Woesearchaeota archaeon]
MNSKGYVYSLIALLIVFTAAFLTRPTDYTITIDEQRFIENRILLVSNNINQFRTGFFESAITSTGKSTLNALAYYRAQTDYQQYYNSRDDFEEDFKTAILYGHVVSSTGQNISLRHYPGIDFQYSLMELFERYEELAWRAHKINYTFSRDPDDYQFIIIQDDSTGAFSIRILSNIRYTVEIGHRYGTGNIASWNITDQSDTIIPIAGLKDPLLLIGSGGSIERRINPFVTERFNKTVFEIFLSRGQYLIHSHGLSYIGRFYGSKDYQDCCGMISGINESLYIRYPIGGYNTVSDVSFIDCEYFPYPYATSVTCRRPDNILVYGIRGISNSSSFTDPELWHDDGRFPLTITPYVALEIFNMTVYDRTANQGDLVDVYDDIAFP